MPELPDVEVYREALERHVVGHRLEAARLASPFVLRSVEPPLAAAVGRDVVGAERLGKRLVLGLDGGLFAVVHLMIAGRLRWKRRGASERARGVLVVFDFEHGSLVLTEAGKRRRASLHLVAGRAALAEHDPGGLDVRSATPAAFAERLQAESRTLKRALCDPHVLDGIGNAYSDEILHAARLSPFRHTTALDDAEMDVLVGAIREVLAGWTLPR